jgi:vesicle-associated membrane protein 7
MASIIFLSISNDYSDTPLAEISLKSGNFKLIALKLLEKCKNEEDASKSYSYQNEYMFHFHKKEGISVLCMATSNYSNRRAYSFLFEIRDKVSSEYGNDIKKAVGFSIKKHFIAEVTDIMIEYNKKKEDDKFAVIDKNIADVKNIMIQNIDKLLENQEKIEILVSKTDELAVNAKVFSKTSSSVKRYFLCKNIKLTLIVALILVAIIFFVVVLSCGGFEFNKCK